MSESTRPRLVIHAIVMMAIGTLIFAICGWAFGRHYVEKLATQLALPCGLIWLGLLWLTYVALWRDRARLGVPLLVVFLFYWIAGSWYTGEWIARQFEMPYQHADIRGVEPFDYLIVLGGGLTANEDGDIWLGTSGDRVALAARLYHQGKVGKLIATGENFEWSSGASYSRARVWRDLNIPDDDIIEVGGRNTSEEMENLRRLLQDLPAGRVGLLTSAFHLSRGLRLANDNGIDVEPVAADFLSGPVDPIPLSLIPSRRGFHRTEACVRELMAGWVGR